MESSLFITVWKVGGIFHPAAEEFRQEYNHLGYNCTRIDQLKSPSTLSSFEKLSWTLFCIVSCPFER